MARLRYRGKPPLLLLLLALRVEIGIAGADVVIPLVLERYFRFKLTCIGLNRILRGCNDIS